MRFFLALGVLLSLVASISSQLPGEGSGGGSGNGPAQGISLSNCFDQGGRVAPESRRCYVMDSFPQQWVDAAQGCELRGQADGQRGTLASVHNLEELEQIRQVWTKNGADTDRSTLGGAWIGLNDRAFENTYVWQDESPQILSPLPWANVYGNQEPSGIDDCVSFGYLSDGNPSDPFREFPAVEGFVDNPCTLPQPAVCQVMLIEEPSRSSLFTDWADSSGRCAAGFDRRAAAVVVRQMHNQHLQIADLQIFAANDPSVNVASSATCFQMPTTGFYYNGDRSTGESPEINDGDINTFSHSGDAGTVNYAYCLLPEPLEVVRVVISPRQDHYDRSRHFRVELYRTAHDETNAFRPDDILWSTDVLHNGEPWANDFRVVSGVQCGDTDECYGTTGGHNNCNEHATCTNTFGSFTCECGSHHTGNGVECDPDECALQTHNCHANATCADTFGSFSCMCPEGLVDWHADGTVCDIDECEAFPCEAGYTCNNTLGSYECLDPCRADTHNCGPNARCFPTDASFVCECDPGFQDLTCKALCPTYDYAESMFQGGAQHSILHDCPLCRSIRAIELDGTNQFLDLGTTRFGGEYSIFAWVFLDRGIVAEARVMEFFNTAGDLNTTDSILTAIVTRLGNVIGSRIVNHRAMLGATEIYSGGGAFNLPTERWVPVTMVASGDALFTYISDELVGYNALTQTTATVDRNHSFIGYGASVDGAQYWNGRIADVRVYSRALTRSEVREMIFDGRTYAEDVIALAGMECSGDCVGTHVPSCTEFDFCASSPCSPNAICQDDPPPSSSGSCACKSGFTGNGFVCADVDECIEAVHDCDVESSACTNTNGSFSCTCKTGYTPEGPTSCRNVDECAQELHNCAADAMCTDTAGSFTCKCNAGYDGSGLKCSDADECATELNDCGANAQCYNTNGSFVCECIEGYENAGCKTLCPTYDFSEAMFRGGAKYSIITDCPLCQSTRAIDLVGPSQPEQFVDLGTSKFGGNFAISVWLYLDSYNTHARVFDIFNNHFGDDNILMTAGHDSNENRLRIHFSVRIDSREVLNSSPETQFPLRQWFHVVVVVDGVDSTTYYDGEPIHEARAAEATPTIDRRNTWIGQDGFAGTQKWDGRIADFRVYKRALTGAEVRNVYNGTNLYAEDVHMLAGLSCAADCAKIMKTTCDDVDECASDVHNCGPSATCSNAEGSFTCACNVGYNGSGVSCEDQDECVLAIHDCDTAATCTNTEGSFSCVCDEGFVDWSFGTIGTICDRDQCLDGTHNCPPSNGACVDTMDSFTCLCDVGYSFVDLDGISTTCDNLDECVANVHNCHENATCTDIDGSFECPCIAGFVGDGVATCSDLDECLESPCASEATCMNLPGTYLCECNIGFFGNGDSCQDTDECQEATDNCDANALCSNTPGSFLCECGSGYRGDGVSCSDIDECQDPSKCDPVHASCLNTIGGFECRCVTGYNSSNDGVTCFEVHECDLDLDTCGDEATCMNTDGSFTCQCNVGFEGDGVRCSDVDECANSTHSCVENAACTNNIGSFDCSCNVGFDSNGFDCLDDDECETESHNCHLSAACANTNGSFTCTCNSGYFTTDGGVSCADVNECEQAVDPCNSNATCSNTLGSFFCECNNGYDSQELNDNECMDVDECQEATDNCDANALCSNTPGSFLCECGSGYRGDGVSCSDIDECQDPSKCDPVHASCLNTIGGFECRCVTGYNSSNGGVTCFEVHECDLDLDTCGDEATCMNTDGSFTCQCNVGFEGDGVRCSDVDECADAVTEVCHTNATCANTRGSFQCSCIAGFDGNGETCTNINECVLSSHNCDAATTACLDTEGSFTCACGQGYQQFSSTECVDTDECVAGLHACDPIECINTNGSFVCVNTVTTLPSLDGCQAGFSPQSTFCNSKTYGRQSFGSEKCFFVVDEYVDWSTASNMCNTFGGSLASIASDAENSILLDLRNISGVLTTAPLGRMWIGLNDLQTEGAFEWSDGSPFTFARWSDSQPNNFLGAQDCAQIWQPSGEWQDDECEKLIPFACSAMTDVAECADVDECAMAVDDCHPNAHCSNTYGSFTCACNSGYIGNGISCVNVDECASDLDDCPTETTCSDTFGSFTCACSSGYSGSGYSGNGTSCVNVDECLSGLDDCPAAATCSDTLGSFTCECGAGFVLNPVGCAASVLRVTPHASQTTNVNYLEGSDIAFHISVRPFQSLVVFNNRVNGIWGPEERIFIPSAPAFETYVDAAGWRTESTSNNVIQRTFAHRGAWVGEDAYVVEVQSSISSEIVCTTEERRPVCEREPNECLLGTDNCHADAACTKTVGSFTCNCHSGFESVDGGVTCFPGVDECQDSVHNCHTLATCTNVIGSYSCECPAGYTGDGVSCEDADECMLQTHACAAQAECSNTAGSYHCTCGPGYSGNGASCNDQDECAMQTHSCSPDAECTNSDGSFTCVCRDGLLDWNGDGTLCDVDECASQELNVCDGNSTCTNTYGSFQCDCNHWFGIPNSTTFHFGFEAGEALSWWSETTTSTDSQLGSFLGRFDANNQEATLNLTTLPPHSEIILDFEFLQIDFWTGETFSVFVDDEEVLRKSFYHEDHTCAVNTFNVFDSRWSDAVHHFRISLAHTRDTAAIRFEGPVGADLEDQSWAVDNVNVTVHSAGSEEYVGAFDVQGSCESCNDGVLNQNEEEVDSGGVCDLPSYTARTYCFPLDECTIRAENTTCYDLDGSVSSVCPYLVLCWAPNSWQ